MKYLGKHIVSDMRHTLMFKVFTLFTALTFFMTPIGGVDLTQIASAVETPISGKDAISGMPGMSGQVLDVREFSVPMRLGEIKDAFTGTNGKTIIHIQDAHCNYAAQHTIADLVGYSTKTYGIDLAFMEGGMGDYDLRSFFNIGNPVTREKVADMFVKDGTVNGAEYLAISNPGILELYGIEDESLYREDLSAYRRSIVHKDEIDKYLNMLTHFISNMKQKVYNPDMREMDEKTAQYRDNKREFKEYTQYILKKAKDTGVDLNNYKGISSLIEILKAEGGIDFNAAQKERNRLVDMLNSKLSKKDMEDLMSKSLENKRGDISNDAYYSYVFRKARFSDIDLKSMPNLIKYSDYLKKYDMIDKTQVFGELKDLEKELMEKYATTQDQKDLYTLDSRLTILRNMFNALMVKSEFDYYMSHKKDFDIDNFTDFIGKKCSAYGFNFKIDRSISVLDEYRKDMEEFYSCSLKRDDAFIKNIGKKMTGENRQMAVLVTGGFHKEHLKQLFRDNGYSYVEIMPKFGQTPVENPYFKLLSGKQSNLDDFIKKAMEYTPDKSTIAVESLFSRMGIDSSKQSMIDMKLRLFEKLINKPGEDFILKTEWGEIVFNTKAKGVDTTGKPLPGFEVDEGDLYLSATVRPFPKEDAQNIDFGGKEFDVALVNGDILTKEQQEVWIDVLGIAASVMDINDQSNQSLKEDLRRNLIYRLRQEGMNRRLGETEAQTQAEALVNNILNNPRIQIKIWKQSIGRRGGHIGVSSRYEKTDASGVTKEYAEYGMIYLSPSLKDHKNGMLIGLLHELGAVLRLTDAENVKFGADDKKLAEIAMILAERAKDPNNIYTEEVKPADPRRDMAMMLPASYRNTFEDELEAAVQAVKALGDNLELEKVNVIINAILNMKFEVYFKSDKAEKAQLLAEMNAMERLKLIRGVAITILEGKDNMNPEQLDGLSSVPGMVFIFLNRIMESENVKEMMAKEDKKLVERVLLKKDIEALVHEAEKLPANKPGDPDIGSYARQINPEVNNNQDLRDGLSELLDAIELQKRRAEREGLPIPLEYDNVINKIRPLLAKLQTGERGARDMAMTLPAVVDPELLQAFNGARVKIDRWIQQMGDSFTAASEAWLKWSDGVKKGTIKVDAHTLGNITEIEGRVKIAKQAADELTSLMGSFNGRDNLNREEMEQVYWAWGALHDASRKLLEFMEDSNRTPDDDRPVGLIANWDQNTKNHPEFMPLASFSKVIDENFFTLNEAFVSQGNRGDGDRAMTKDEGVYNIDVIDSGVYIMKVEGKNCIRVAPKMAPLTKTNLPAVKQAFIDLTKRVFEAAHKGLFNSEPLFQAISIGDLLKDKDRSSEAQNLATQVKSALQKGVVKMKIGNITYMIFDETDDKQVKSVLVGVDKVSKALIKLWTDKGIVSKTPTEKEMAMINEKLKSRIIIAAYADAVKDQFKDIKDKAFMLSLTRDPNEEIAVTPIGKVGEAGLAMFSHFEKEEKRAIDATSVTGDEMGTSRELVAKALLAISGIEDIGTILAMAAQILANGDLRKMSGLLFIQVRPIDINILKEISEAEREVLRAL